MSDIASATGLSLKTVSRALNNEPNVRPAVRERVMREAKARGFRRNSIAASLASTRSSLSIGALIEDLGDPFWAAMVSGIEEVARERQYALLIASSNEEPDLERETLDLFLSRRVEGVIVVPSSDDHSYLTPDLERGTAIVFVDRPATNIEVDTVLISHRDGAASGIRHLLEHGHTAIGYIGHASTVYTGRERWQGFSDAMAAAGVPIVTEFVQNDVQDIESARAATARLLSLPEPPTAIFADNNRSTAGVLKAFSNAGVDDVALVGFDDFELADVLGVTVVSHDAHVLGRTAAIRLFDRLEGLDEPSKQIVLETRIVQRGSGERHPPHRG
ncbi:MAG: LacI family transcriptional regulator [Aeromicrobium sp.]|nr:LacI family transcriptional regulator [Aeromicrobium sp.]